MTYAEFFSEYWPVLAMILCGFFLIGVVIYDAIVEGRRKARGEERPRDMWDY